MDQQPPAGGDQDRGPYVVAIFWAMVAVLVVVVSMRLWGRYMIGKTGADDWMMVFTVVSVAGLGLQETRLTQAGLTHHKRRLCHSRRIHRWFPAPLLPVAGANDPSPQVQLDCPAVRDHRLQYWEDLGGATDASHSRVERLLAQMGRLHWRWKRASLQPTKHHPHFRTMPARRGALEPFTGCAGSGNLLGSENTDRLRHLSGQYVILLSIVRLRANGSLGWNVLIDMLLAILPVTIFWTINLTWQRKVGTCVLLGLGFIAALCAAIKTQYLASLNARSDLTCMSDVPVLGISPLTFTRGDVQSLCLVDSRAVRDHHLRKCTTAQAHL
jgi:hypothetical protein